MSRKRKNNTVSLSDFLKSDSLSMGKIDEKKRVDHLKIGVDFGGVLSIHDSTHKEGKSHKSVEINIPDAISSLHELKSQGYELYIVSFCGYRRAIDTKESIDNIVPGLFKDIFFVTDRRYKPDICRHLGLDVMIDDTRSIIEQIVKRKACPFPILFGGNMTGQKTKKEKKEEKEEKKEEKEEEKEEEEKNPLCKYKILDTWPNIVKYCHTLKHTNIPLPNPDISRFIHPV